MQYLISILIPVYNSEGVVNNTVTTILDVVEKHNYNTQLILVNDGSSDNSWEVIKALAKSNKNIVSINLLKNYGQHTAQFCGLSHVEGDYIITMDDDLQNPPDQIPVLVNKIKDGKHDLVVAKFITKKHAWYRRIGTTLVNHFIYRIFDKPKDLQMTNFRIFSKIVAKRILNYNTNHPYIPGLLLMHSYSPTNVLTEHHKRTVGKSNYSFSKILKLLSRLLINYSSYPLKVLTYLGIIIATFSFIVGFYIFFKAIYGGYDIPGWASIMVLMSFLNGITILISGVIGIYISRTLTQVSKPNPYIIEEIIKNEESI